MILRSIALILAGTLLAACDSADTPEQSAIAQFGQNEIDNSKTVVMVGPNGRNIVVLQQLSLSRQCWTTSGGTPQVVNPLLLSFDFTGICSRATDSNGYSIRTGGVDQTRYALSLLRQGHGVLLVGAERFAPNAPKFVLGSAAAVSSTDWVRINLAPGWRLTKRTYQGSELGHFYFTNNAPASQLLVSPDGTGPTPSPTPNNGGLPFSDISRSIYKNEIAEAASVKLVSGFADGTYQPSKVLSREEAAALVVAHLRTLPGITVSLPQTATTPVYRDVAITRWSAALLQYVNTQGIALGYPDRTFRPTAEVTRAELMSMLQKTAAFALRNRNLDVSALSTNPRTFDDIAGHWAAPTIEMMSGVCGTASPVGEQGSAFAPNSPVQRDYAAAASLRLRKCLMALP